MEFPTHPLKPELTTSRPARHRDSTAATPFSQRNEALSCRVDPETVRLTMQALVPAILNIDGGSPECVERFIKDANRALLQADMHYCYKETGDSHYPLIAVPIEGNIDAISLHHS